MNHVRPASRALCALTLLATLAAPGRDAAAADAAVAFTLSANPTETREGEHLVVHLDAAIPEGYHFYSMTPVAGPIPLTIKHPPQLSPRSDWHAPKPKVERDPNFNVDVEYYAGAVRHSRSFRLEDRTPGSLDFKVRGQICNVGQCILVKETLTLVIALQDGPPRAEFTSAAKLSGFAFSATTTLPTTDDAGLSKPIKSGSQLPTEGGLIGYIIFAFLAGLGALLTPCVFPMIPITVSFFTKFSEVSLRRSALMASVYTLSIILTFTLLGILVSVIFGAVGMQAISTSTTFNLFLFTLLVVFSLNLFGLFEIRVPNALINKSTQQEQALMAQDDGALGSQMAGVFFMALTFTLVSFTCTVAFIGIVLAEAAKGNWFYPTIGMLAFSTGFSLPFFLLAMFPAYANKLRGKAGDWMVAVKVVLGFLELAAAFKFLSNVDLIWSWGLITRPLVLAFWSAIFFAAGLYLLRIFSLPHDTEGITKINPLRMCVALLMFAMAIHCASGLRDTRSMGGWIDAWLPPAIYPGQEAVVEGGDDGHLAWIQNDIPGGMEQAKASDMPLFIDFTGYNCSNCRLMEMSVFPRPDVKRRLEQMVRVAAYTDGQGDKEAVGDSQREYQLRRFETAALPYYAIIEPRTDAVLATFADMAQDPKDFVAFLDDGLKAYAAKAGSPPMQPPTREASNPGPSSAPQAAAADDDVVILDASQDLHQKEPLKPVTLTLDGPEVDLTFPRLDGGEPFSLSSLRGSWVFVNFWADWCSPCKRELEKDFPKALGERSDVRLVTIAFNEASDADKNRAFLKNVQVPGAVHLLGGVDVDEAELPKAFGSQDGSLPLSYLISPEGRLVFTQRGVMHAEEITHLLAARPNAP